MTHRYSDAMIVAMVRPSSPEALDRETGGALRFWLLRDLARRQNVTLRFVRWPDRIFGVIAADPSDQGAWNRALIRIYREAERREAGSLRVGICP